MKNVEDKMYDPSVSVNWVEWNRRFIAMAREIATWSKDPNTQCGAVAIGPDRRILSVGYNGFPRQIMDNKERWADRDTKYKYVVHSEMNLIYNACHNGVSLAGSTLYVTGLPVCSECAKGVIQVGFSKVIMSSEYFEPNKTNERWLKSFEATAEMFEEAGIDFRIIE